jgi:hypothetical protein
LAVFEGTLKNQFHSSITCCYEVRQIGKSRVDSAMTQRTDIWELIDFYFCSVTLISVGLNTNHLVIVPWKVMTFVDVLFHAAVKRRDRRGLTIGL